MARLAFLVLAATALSASAFSDMTMLLNFGGKKPSVPATKPSTTTKAVAGKATPAKAVPAKATPKAAPKAAPVKAAPVKAAPVKAAPAKSAPAKSAPVKTVKKSEPAPVMAFDESFAGGLLGNDVEAKNFDPFGLSVDRDEATLAWYRSSELKHGRICMLAALGLFVQNYAHLPDDVFNNPKGLDALYQVAQERPLAIAQILLAIGAVEVVGLTAAEGRAPGDFGWDPLGLQKSMKLEGDKLQAMQLRELKNGRLAMVSTAGMLVQESLTNQGVIEQINSGHLNPFGDGQGFF